MGRIPPEDEALLKRYADAVASRLRLSALVLFGSRARGTALRTSDYDLAVVSPDFAGVSPVRRAERLDGLWEGSPAAEEVCLTPEELLSLASLLLCDVVAEGIPVRDDGVFAGARTRLAEFERTGRLRRTPLGWAFLGAGRS